MKSAALFLLALPLACLRASAAPMAEPPPFAESVASHLRTVTAGATSGIAVLVARDGRIVYQDGFGFADLAHQTPVTVLTKFRIGSITKQFTAAAILRLAEQGKLSLDDHLAKYFPGFPRGDIITLRHLLNHTSGIHSYTDKPGFISQVASPIEPAKLIASFRDDPPDFAPGMAFRYDNSGYFLLGEIVVRVSGQAYGDFLRENFFEPLGMKDTGVYRNAAPPPGIATGYAVTNGQTTPALDWDMSWAGGAGAIYSTVGDLFAWNEALFGGRVVNATSFKAATTPVELPPDADGMKYGFGLLISTLKGLPKVSHNGGLNGWQASLVRLPEQHTTVVVLVNSLPTQPGLEPDAMSQALAQKFLEDDIRAAPTPVANDAALDPKTLDDYAGRYDFRGAVMSVTTEDGKLFVQLTGQRRFQIFPKAKDEFFLKVVDAQEVFLRDGQGRVVAVRHTQNGNTAKCPRLPDLPAGLTTEKLEAIVGQYDYHGAVMTVTREGEQLYAQLTGQQKLPIFPKSETEFEWHVVKATVKFVPGPDGKIEKALHTQNGHTQEAPKIR